jgi:tRNA (pseudouridine54-N1)-methyltransferase
MKVLFFIKSGSVNVTNYTIKDIPGSSGRLDVISRCILAAILNENGFKNDIQIWTFLEKYGAFIFKPKLFDYDGFPKNEILLTDYFVDIIKNREGRLKYNNNPLKNINYSHKDIFTIIKEFMKKNYSIYVLNEGGVDFFEYLKEILSKKNIIFVIGSQTGEIIKSKELVELNLPNISLGTQSYLASSVIRLIRINLGLEI